MTSSEGDYQGKWRNLGFTVIIIIPSFDYVYACWKILAVLSMVFVYYSLWLFTGTHRTKQVKREKQRFI
jgi:hypothetical protein